MNASLNKRHASMLSAARTLCAAALIGYAPFICATDEPQKHSIAIMDFELIDNTGESAKDAEQKRRLAMISQQLREAIAENQLYTVVDNAPAASLIAELQKRFELHSCNGCDVDIGHALNTPRVLTGWVQKVSNLILNINIQVRDVQTGNIVLNKSVDIRGNTDQTWSRGIRYMVRSMVENKQAN
ncbi:DUF2380 domain-containing protein [Candidimonas sp. SYP-B2681]|uniref:DUF3280 domain-containing protein n=1 Tax=Candidimonas sp. SYP-B2681 TaxID=2497686 RepID=UPI000F888543|nr:DUF3280 domain-containing protein [Candidimonas sp. SYP-B2681]RTZ42421.1 DUF2380 domain-containing protein [Candidimonas sp. SYP-B2681]